MAVIESIEASATISDTEWFGEETELEELFEEFLNLEPVVKASQGGNETVLSLIMYKVEIPDGEDYRDYVKEKINEQLEELNVFNAEISVE